MADGNAVDGNAADEKKWQWPCTKVFIVLVFVLAILITLVLFQFLSIEFASVEYRPEIILSVLLGTSVIALLLALTFTASIFKYLELAKPDQSLGLPEGSIRAVIALSLILIFMISSVFLYTQISRSDFTREIDLSQAEYDNLSKESVYYSQPYGATNGTRYTVMLQMAENKDSVDIAKQIITTISTLIVAVAGFYFGTRAVAVGSEAAIAAKRGTGGDIKMALDPYILAIPTDEGRLGETIKNFTILGENFKTIKEVRLVHQKTGDSMKCEDIMSSSKKITCTLKIPSDSKEAPIGMYTVVVVNDEQGQGRREDAFTVKVKKEEGD